MTNWISNAITYINTFLKQLQVKQFLGAVLVGFLLLTTNVNPPTNQNLPGKIDRITHQKDSVRPKTTGEWNRQAEETEDAPGERLQRIGEQSGKAFQEFGSGYGKAMKDSTRDLGKSAERTAKDLSDSVR